MVEHLYFGAASFARPLIAGVRGAPESEPALSNRYAGVGHSEGEHGALEVDAHAAEAPELTLVGIVASALYTSTAAHADGFAVKARMARDATAAQGFRVSNSMSCR